MMPRASNDSRDHGKPQPRIKRRSPVTTTFPRQTVPKSPENAAPRRRDPTATCCYPGWTPILQTASKGCGIKYRGVLARVGEPVTAEDVAVMTGFDERGFQRALEFFSSPKMGWLTTEVVDQ